MSTLESVFHKQKINRIAHQCYPVRFAYFSFDGEYRNIPFIQQATTTSAALLSSVFKRANAIIGVFDSIDDLQDTCEEESAS
ncbi:MAG: hypothetical protein U5K84_00335 [Alkalibacterium sp.]|nr:hypothetical protein [Alkalibacterium sp.]